LLRKWWKEKEKIIIKLKNIMEFLTELAWKMTISNLFALNPSTDFSYSYIIFWFLIWLVIFASVFDLIAKNQSNKFLKKAMKWQMWQIRWTFPLVWAFLLICRLEWIPFLSMKFLFVLYFLIFVVYLFSLIFSIKNAYLKRLEKQEKYSKK
jgi:low temperature requirement protein LtrA